MRLAEFWIDHQCAEGQTKAVQSQRPIFFGLALERICPNVCRAMKFQQMIPSKTLALFAVLLAGLLTAGAQSGNLRFSASTYSIAESGAAATITVTRSGGSAGTLTVDFATKDSGGGTAAPDQDYFR